MATTASRLQSPQGATFHFYFRIQGVGWWNSSTSQSQRLYCFTDVPDWTPSATQKFIDGMEYPGTLSSSISPLGGIETPSDFTVDFNEFYDGATYQSSPIWANLFASSRAIYDRSTGLPVTRLTATLTHTATTANVENTGAFPSSGLGQLCIGNETVTTDFGVKTATTFGSITRGLHVARTGDDNRQRHRVSGADDVAVEANPIVSTVPFTWFNRRIAVYMFHRDQDGTWGTEAESLIIFKGRIQSRSWTGSQWRFSARSIISELDRKIFTLANTEKRTVGVYVPLAQPPDDTTTIRFFDSAGSVVTADSYSFTYTQSYFDSTESWTQHFTAQSKAARPGGSGPFLILSSYWGYPQDTFLLWIGNKSASFSQSNIVLPEPVRLLLAVEGGETLYNPVILSYGTDATVGDSFGGGVRVSMVGGGAFVMEAHQNETLRVNNILGWHTGGTLISQGDWPTAQRFAAVELEDDAWIDLTITSVTSGNPAQAVARYSFGSVYFPSGRSYAARAFVHRAGAARIRTAFIPYPDGLGKQLLRMMVSSGGGVNGTYDVLADGFGIGIDDNDIDIASFLKIDTSFGGSISRFFAFCKPHSVREIIEEEAKLLGMMVTVVDGKITLRKLPSSTMLNASGLVVLDESNQDDETDRPTFHESPDSIYNSFTIKTSYDDAVEKHMGAPITIVDTQSQDLFMQSRTLEIGSLGLMEGPAVTDYIAPLTSRLLMFRFPYPRVERSITRDLWTRISVGDRVRLTERTLPNMFAASYGVTNASAFVERLSIDFKNRNGRVTLRLFPNDRFAPLAPSAAVTGYTAGTRTLTLSSTTFGGDGAGGNDALLFDAGDRIMICERNPASPATADFWHRTVESRTSTTIVVTVDLNAGGGDPTFDDNKEYFLTFALYSNVQSGANAAAQVLEASFIADQTDGNIEATQDFYAYS